MFFFVAFLFVALAAKAIPMRKPLRRNLTEASGGLVSLSHDVVPHEVMGVDAALVLIAHDRVSNVKRTLRELLALEGAEHFHFYLSLDAPEKFDQMQKVVDDAVADFKKPVTVLKKTKPTTFGTDLRSVVFKITEHYKSVFEELFPKHEWLFVIEDDLVPARDLLTYIGGSAWLLRDDPQLLCVSAWNDNGFTNAVSDQKALWRTNFFPGKGWLSRRSTFWDHVKTRWPSTSNNRVKFERGGWVTDWDGWVKEQKLGDCLVPEVPRVHHVSKHGAHINQEWQIEKLSDMALSTLAPGELPDESVFSSAGSWEKNLHHKLATAALTSLAEIKHNKLQKGKAYLLPYDRINWQNVSKAIHNGIEHWNQARGTYKGVLHTNKGGADIYLVDRESGKSFLPA